jgi:hypothetical protein
MWQKGPPTEQEALEVMVAYLSIMEPEKRRKLLLLAERYARESTPLLVQDNDTARRP